jgi:hypothetical protein
MTAQDLQPVSIRGLIAFHIYYIEKVREIENIPGAGWEFVIDKSWYILQHENNIYGVMDSLWEISPNMMLDDDDSITMTYQEYVEGSIELVPPFLLTEAQFTQLREIYSVMNTCVLAMMSVEMLSSAAEVGGVYELLKDRIQKRIDYLEKNGIPIPPIENFLSCGFRHEFDNYGSPITRSQIVDGIIS